jgi:ornithine--oxo-acid transaminase
MSHRTPLEDHYSANNYQPLPVTLVKGKGVYLWDDEGKKYLDMMSAYSAVSHGHCHPKLVAALTEQANTLNVTSRAFFSNKLESFLKCACELTGQEKALPMNSGAEAVETAIKAARKWGHTAKGIPEDQAEIIVCAGNFHGRTTTIISFSSEAQYKYGFGPLTPGFKTIPYGDAAALKAAITPNTAGFLVEPIQGESGIHVPPPGYLKQCADICRENNVLLICDEIQTGLGRTGKFLASEHDNVKPDAVILGKALGGGMLPISLFLSKKSVMAVFTPGDHGSTFGGNALAATVGLAALEVLIEEDLSARSAALGDYFIKALRNMRCPLIKEIRGKGLFIGIELDTQDISARDVCIALMKNGLLTKDTHQTVIRLCPPLVITKEQLDDAVEIIERTLQTLKK